MDRYQAGNTERQFALWPAIRLRQHKKKDFERLYAELLARERILHAKSSELTQQAEEFEHRLLNAVQMISSLLSLQSRAASPEAAAQLRVAANRILAFGQVHRRLHLLDRRKSVEFKPFLQQLCADLSGLLLADPVRQAVDFQGVDLEIPAALGIPLGFIVSELVTNSVKHGDGCVKIRLQSISPALHTLSISDDGSGLPEDFEIGKCKGFGMKIVLALVKQIGGEIHSSNGGHGAGAHFVVTFNSPKSERSSQKNGKGSV